MKTHHHSRFFSLSLLRGLLSLSLILGVCVPLNFVPEAEAAAADCRPTTRHMGRVKQKIRLAKRIRNGAQRRRILKRLRKTQTQLTRQYRRCLAAPAATPAAAAASFIEMVPVGNPGNAKDATGYGAVDDAFQIGKYEVNLDQYTAFLNAVAATDTYNLYNASMATNLNIAGIQQNGGAPPFTYTVIGSGKRPVTYVSWFDAARFCNWLHNGMPTGAQDASTTETGAYALNGEIKGVGFVREATALYWIPSENEWYKAAYHDPRDKAAGGPPGDDNYWLYPTMSDTAPGNMTGPALVNHANFLTTVYSVTQNATRVATQNYLTDGGSYPGSASYYGTYDQGGNVYEWNEAVIIGTNRGLRGGSWNNSESGLQSSYRSSFYPGLEYHTGFGFRIASP